MAEFDPPVGWVWSKRPYAVISVISVISVMTTTIGTGNSYTRMGAIITRRNA